VKASAGVWAGNTLYLSGLTGVLPATGSLASGLDPQVHQIGRNHSAVLGAAGLTLDDIVSGHVYLNDMQDYQPMNAIYKEYFSKGPGVRTTLMPFKTPDKGGVRVQASFIAARTQSADASKK
jgi:2-iminobutanoate/2-iminopropanoate deaminase